jgi:hypothetical protein
MIRIIDYQFPSSILLLRQDRLLQPRRGPVRFCSILSWCFLPAVHAVINHIHKTQEWFEADAGRSKEARSKLGPTGYSSANRYL